MLSLIKPTKVSILDLDSIEHVYSIGRFPAVVGLEIIAKVPANVAGLSKQLPHLRSLVLQMCQFVEVELPTEDGGAHNVRLTTSDIVDNHVPDGQTLLHLCFEIMRHNTSFFGTDRKSILDSLSERLVDLLPKITQTLAASWESSFPNASPP